MENDTYEVLRNQLDDLMRQRWDSVKALTQSKQLIIPREEWLKLFAQQIEIDKRVGQLITMLDSTKADRNHGV